MSQGSIKNPKMTKKLLEISSFYTSVPKLMIICYTVPMAGDGCNFCFSNWVSFCPFNNFFNRIVLSKKVDEQQKTLNVSIQDFQNVIKLLKQYNYLLAKRYSDSP